MLQDWLKNNCGVPVLQKRSIEETVQRINNNPYRGKKKGYRIYYSLKRKSLKFHGAEFAALFCKGYNQAIMNPSSIPPIPDIPGYNNFTNPFKRGVEFASKAQHLLNVLKDGDMLVKARIL